MGGLWHELHGMPWISHAVDVKHELTACFMCVNPSLHWITIICYGSLIGHVSFGNSVSHSQNWRTNKPLFVYVALFGYCIVCVSSFCFYLAFLYFTLFHSFFQHSLLLIFPWVRHQCPYCIWKALPYPNLLPSGCWCKAMQGRFLHCFY